MDKARIKKAATKIVGFIDEIRRSHGRMSVSDVVALSDIRYQAHEILHAIQPKDPNEKQPPGSTKSEV